MTADTHLTKRNTTFSLLFFSFLHKLNYISDCGIDVFSPLFFRSTFNYLQFLSFPFPAFMQTLIIYHMIATTEEANPKYTEEEVSRYSRASGQLWGGGGMCTESWRMSRSLLGWKGERQSRQREECLVAWRHKIYWHAISPGGKRSGVARWQGCVNGFEVGGEAGMGRKVKNRLLHSRDQSIPTCGQWQFLRLLQLLKPARFPRLVHATWPLPQFLSISQSCLSRKKEILLF